jgi:predicted transcriptional regulator
MQEDESVRSVGSKAVNLDGITVREILLHLRQGGTRTEERLEREMQLDKVIVHNYLVRLSMEGVIRFGRTGRNNICVRLVDYDPAKSIEDKND